MTLEECDLLLGLQSFWGLYENLHCLFALSLCSCQTCSLSITVFHHFSEFSRTESLEIGKSPIKKELIKTTALSNLFRIQSKYWSLYLCLICLYQDLGCILKMAFWIILERIGHTVGNGFKTGGLSMLCQVIGSRIDGLTIMMPTPTKKKTLANPKRCHSWPSPMISVEAFGSALSKQR